MVQRRAGQQQGSKQQQQLKGRQEPAIISSLTLTLNSMEYQTPRVEIVGEYNGEAVANPLPFPDPIIYDGSLQKLRVCDSQGAISERTCLFSQLYVFELGRMLKEAIYGQVNCGCRLESDGDGIFRRTSDLVAIKIISKAKLLQLAGRTQEDPIKVNCPSLPFPARPQF